jgi:hypothetical protein
MQYIACFLLFSFFILFLDTSYFYRHIFIFLRAYQERSAIVICTLCYGFVVTCFLIGKQKILKNSLEYSRGCSRGKLFLRILPHYLQHVTHLMSVDGCYMYHQVYHSKILRFAYKTFICFAWILEQSEIITQ